MMIISYHVQASHLPSYTTSLLKIVQDQQDISLSSGDQTVSVSSLLLRISSPLLSSLLQSSCPCSQSSSIVLPSSLSSALPSLVSLLYTGCASNLSRDKVNQLRLLTKELGMETSFSTEPYKFEPEILGSGFGYSSTEQLASGSVVDDSIDEDDTDSSYQYSEGLEMTTSDNFARKPFNNNQVIGSEHKRRRKVKFGEERVQNDEFSGSDLLSMCPPVRPRVSSGHHILVEPEDSILSDTTVRNEVGSELLEGEGHNGSGGWDDTCTGGETIEVITVGDDVVDDDFGFEDDIAEILIMTSDENAIDPFCEIEIDSFNHLEKEKASQTCSFFCKICDQAFVTDHHFKAHLASTHYKSRLFKEFEKFGNVCPICNEKSRDTLANMEHIGGQHEKVYEYYEADQFSDRGDVNSNLGRPCSKNNESVKVHGRNHSTSGRSPPLRGILKLTNSGNKEEPPKSILRTPRPKSPVAQHSILKLSKSSAKKPPRAILKSDGIRGLGGVDTGNGRKVLLSVQDDVGDMMMDV